MDKSNIKNFILELFFPSFCLGCRREGAMLCIDCKATLEISEFDYCLCGKHPLRLQRFDLGKNVGKCPRCRDAKLDGLYFALPYQEKILTKKLIYQFKYVHLKSLAIDLAGILVTHFVLTHKNTDDIWENSILVPVPMHLAKQKDRGYNQALELARELGHLVNVPSISDNLIKIRPTKPQIKLSATERAQNLLGAFHIKNPQEFAGKKIFLIDDVYTTGSTMSECAKVLKSAGAKQVWGIAVAREG